MTVRQALEGDGVVEIPRRLPVDRDRGELAEVRSPPPIPGSHGGPESRGLGHDLRLVGVQNSVLPNDDPRVDAGCLDVAQHVAHSPDGIARRRRPPRQLDLHHVARFRAAAIRRRDVHVHDQPVVERHDVGEPAVVRLVAADERGCRPLQDPDDSPLGSVRLALALDADDDAVTVHGLVEIRSGDIQIPGDPVHGMIGRHEPEAARVHVDAAGHQMHAVGQPVPVAANLDELATLDKRRETAAKRAALLAGQLEALQELAQRGRVIDLGADGGEEFVGREHRPLAARYAMSATCKSPTFVSVGPVRTRSPSASKKAYESLAAR